VLDTSKDRLAGSIVEALEVDRRLGIATDEDTGRRKRRFWALLKFRLELELICLRWTPS